MKKKYQLFNERRHCIFFLSLLGKQVMEMGGKFHLRDMFRGVYYYKGLTLGLLANPKAYSWYVYYKGQSGYFSEYEKASQYIIGEFKKRAN